MNTLESINNLIKETENYPVQYPSSYPPPYPVQSGYYPQPPRPRRRFNWSNAAGITATRAMYKSMSANSSPQSVGQLLTDPKLYAAALGGVAVSKGVDAIRGTNDFQVR